MNRFKNEDFDDYAEICKRNCPLNEMCDECERPAEYDVGHALLCKDHFEEDDYNPPSDDFLRQNERKQMGIGG